MNAPDPYGGMGARNLRIPMSVTGGQGAVVPSGLPGPSPTAAPPVPADAGFGAPAPGISGVTPGAVERRLGGLASIPPTAQASPAAGMGPTMQAQQQLGNTVGTDPSALSDPIMMIRQLLGQMR